ncbi:MAG: RluA family pseudouridine synthase [Candidatus Omnitrophota bacterium]|jgi:23S rRNA pseudouridine1911/1915/1917 synthase|nr:MAG: RluA family pseudouridine synthase [Candidatus Omnitrophota bacterium]
MNIEVVYEDDWLLIINKPSGMLTIPAPGKINNTATDILNKDALNKNKAYRLHPCHRLDKETSGLLIYAKGKSTQSKIMRIFKERKIKKAYLALVSGNLSRPQGRISFPVDSQSAVTDYRVKEHRNGYDIVQVYPLTGRKNQIRIHFKRINHPVLGERKYAFGKDFKIKANRLCLHASSLEFVHPVTGRHIKATAPVPKAMESFINAHN